MAWVRSLGRTEQVRTLSTFESAAMERLRAVIKQKSQELAERARAKVTGRLASSVKVRDVDNKFGIKGVIRSPWFVARFFELGYGGKTVRVKAHVRRVRALDIKTRVQDAKGRMRTKTIKGRGDVKAHTRELPRIHRPYMSLALDEMRNDIKNALQQAITGAVNVSRS